MRCYGLPRPSPAYRREEPSLRFFREGSCFLGPKVSSFKRSERQASARANNRAGEWRLRRGPGGPCGRVGVRPRKNKFLSPRLGGSYQLGAERIPLDSAVANGSTLAMLGEFAGKRCLLLGDAHPDTVVDSMKKLGTSESKPMKLDAIKMAHRGSMGNTTPELLGLVACKHFLVSTTDAAFNDPDRETIDTITDQADPDVEIVFSYLCETTKSWSNTKDLAKRSYGAIYSKADGAGVVINL